MVIWWFGAIARVAHLDCTAALTSDVKARTCFFTTQIPIASTLSVSDCNSPITPSAAWVQPDGSLRCQPPGRRIRRLASPLQPIWSLTNGSRIRPLAGRIGSSFTTGPPPRQFHYRVSFLRPATRLSRFVRCPSFRLKGSRSYLRMRTPVSIISISSSPPPGTPSRFSILQDGRSIASASQTSSTESRKAVFRMVHRRL